MKRYTITTLGCKVNQCESAALGHLLESSGAVRLQNAEPAQIVIINTCTVTGKAAMQSRQAIRQAIRSHPQALIVVTGCYAQTAPGEIQAIPGVDLIVGHLDKLRIAELLDQSPSSRQASVLVKENIFQCRDFGELPWAAPEGRTRAFLKIQDGCDTMCTYCIVPYARGRSRSMPAADVFKHLKALGQAGYREVVLTGIHLGAYGADLNPLTSLPQLLSRLGPKPPVDRIRLSSIEPAEVEASLLQQMADPRGCICHHLHIPLQSGDNNILKRMGRPYTREDFAAMVRAVKQCLPHAAMGADVLAGFPGENDTAFAQTVDLLQRLPIAYLHVFPYSPRQGTPAAHYTGQVPQRIVKQRCRTLRDLGTLKRETFLNSMIGNTVEVLVQSTRDRHGDLPGGLSRNYIRVLLQGARVEVNTLVKARITALTQNHSVIATVL